MLDLTSLIPEDVGLADNSALPLVNKKNIRNNTIVVVMGDLLACFGAIMYGLYQVLYKKLSSPPTPSFLFANTIARM